MTSLHLTRLNVIPLLGLALAFACTDDTGKTGPDSGTPDIVDDADADTDSDTDTDTGPGDSTPPDSGAGN